MPHLNRLAIPLLAVALCAALSAADAEAEYQAALQALQSKNYSSALDHFEAALKVAPDSLKYGSEYRMAVIQAESYDRAIGFLEELAEKHPRAAHLHLNLGFAHVDKIPAAGSITQVLLANAALDHFTRSLEVSPTWIGLYTRGNSYLFWPKIFNRTPLGIADLEKALQMQRKQSPRPHHARVYVALGDGHYKLDDLKKAKEIWAKGSELFPNSRALQKRVGSNGDELEELIGQGYNPNLRVDTDLKELWSNQ